MVRIGCVRVRQAKSNLNTKHIKINKWKHGGSMFSGFEKTDWSGSERSLRLCSERSETEERIPPSPPVIPIRRFLQKNTSPDEFNDYARDGYIDCDHVC